MLSLSNGGWHAPCWRPNDEGLRRRHRRTAGAPLSQGKAGNNLWGAIK